MCILFINYQNQINIYVRNNINTFIQLDNSINLIKYNKYCSCLNIKTILLTFKNSALEINLEYTLSN